MPADPAEFLLPPPAPPERKTRARVILFLSAVGHVALLAYLTRAPPERAPPPRAAETVRVLRGEVVTGGSEEQGLRLFGYREAAVGVLERKERKPD